MSCKCKCKYDGKNVIQIKFGITLNVDVNAKIQKMCEKRLYLECCHVQL